MDLVPKNILVTMGVSNNSVRKQSYYGNIDLYHSRHEVLLNTCTWMTAWCQCEGQCLALPLRLEGVWGAISVISSEMTTLFPLRVDLDVAGRDMPAIACRCNIIHWGLRSQKIKLFRSCQQSWSFITVHSQFLSNGLELYCHVTLWPSKCKRNHTSCLW